MATQLQTVYIVPTEPVHNPESEGPIQGLYKKVKTYLPDVENNTIEKFDRTINNVMGGCDKVVASASHQLKKGIPDFRGLQKYANSLTQKVLNEIEDRLNSLINKLETEEVPAGSAVSVKKTEPETRFVRLFRKSKHLNSLILQKITCETSRLAKTAMNVDYPQLFFKLTGNIIFEARVIQSVVNDLFAEWVEARLHSLQVTMQKTKDGFAFVMKNLKNPEEAREKVLGCLADAKNATMKVVNDTLKIKLNKESLSANMKSLYMFLASYAVAIKNKPLEIVNRVAGDSKSLYEKVLKKYKVEKILLKTPKLGLEAAKASN